jgi:hypothetical protein
MIGIGETPLRSGRSGIAAGHARRVERFESRPVQSALDPIVSRDIMVGW